MKDYIFRVDRTTFWTYAVQNCIGRKIRLKDKFVGRITGARSIENGYEITCKIKNEVSLHLEKKVTISSEFYGSEK